MMALKPATAFRLPVSALMLRRIEIIRVEISMYPPVMSLLLVLMLMRMPRGSVRKDVDLMLLCCVYGKYKNLG
jgi:hypothetical protein